MTVIALLTHGVPLIQGALATFHARCRRFIRAAIITLLLVRSLTLRAIQVTHSSFSAAPTAV